MRLLFCCPSVLLLLPFSRDVETNPGPNTRSESMLNIDSLPADPSEPMNVLFKLLKDLHTRSLEGYKAQSELASDVKAIKNGQKVIETKINGLQQRLDLLKEKSCKVNELTKDMASALAQVEETASCLGMFDSRFAELEDR